MRTALILPVLLLACRPSPGEPEYPDIRPYVDTDTDGDGKLPGDTPWDGSAPRLAISTFYEGGATDVLLVDDESVFFYIYEGSFTAQTSGDRVEGYVSQGLVISASTWWGGGIHSEGNPVDLREWDTLHVALRSDDSELESFEIGMVGSVGEGRVSATTYGFVADGQWHVLEIPLADLSGAVGLDAVTVPLLLISASASPGTAILIDDLYFTQGE